MAPLLKASYNRVRASDALKTNSRWTEIVGVDANEMGGNSAVEEMLNATALRHVKGGKKPEKKKEGVSDKTMEILGRTGGFGTGATDYDSLLDLAKQRGAIGGDPARGACKRCGEVGHLTRDCRNFLAEYFKEEKEAQKLMAGSLAAPPVQPGEESDFGSILSDSSDSSDSGSSSDSDSDSDRRRRKSKSKKRSKSKKDKKSKKSKRSKKEKKSKRSRSRSRSRSRDRGRDRSRKDRSRSRSRSRDRRDRERDGERSRSPRREREEDRGRERERRE